MSGEKYYSKYVWLIPEVTHIYKQNQYIYIANWCKKWYVRERVDIPISRYHPKTKILLSGFDLVLWLWNLMGCFLSPRATVVASLLKIWSSRLFKSQWPCPLSYDLKSKKGFAFLKGNYYSVWRISDVPNSRFNRKLKLCQSLWPLT